MLVQLHLIYKNVFQSKAGPVHPRMCVSSYSRISCFYDLDLDPMTLIYELDIDILKMYRTPKTKFMVQGFQKLEHEQHRETHSHTDRSAREGF